MKLRSFFLVFLLGLLSCSSPTSHQDKNLKEKNYFFTRVEKAIDGDTIIISGGRHLRYLGIDAPEVRVRVEEKFIYKPAPFALKAKKRNHQMVQGKKVRIEFDKEKEDKYSRLLGYCYVDKVLVNAQLVREGLAVVSHKAPNVKYRKFLIKAQNEAKRNKRGIWSLAAISPSSAYKYFQEIRPLKARVVKTEETYPGVFLYFSSNKEKNYFYVFIPKSSLPFFYEENIDPVSFYKNKIIYLAGRIRKYKNNFYIIASLPEEIEIK